MYLNREYNRIFSTFLYKYNTKSITQTVITKREEINMKFAEYVFIIVVIMG